MTDFKALTKFLPSQTNPPLLWNLCDQMTRKSDPAVPTSNVTRPRWGYLCSYERRRRSNNRVWEKRRSSGLTGTNHLDRGERNNTDYQSPQPHVHTWQLCYRGKLQYDDPAKSSENKASATRACAAHEQPMRIVCTHSQPMVPWTDRKRKRY